MKVPIRLFEIHRCYLNLNIKRRKYNIVYFSVYIIELSDGSFYTGYTKDLENRLYLHSNKKGSKYVRSRLPLRLVHEERYGTRSDAMRREIQIKKFSRIKKQQLFINKIETKI